MNVQDPRNMHPREFVRGLMRGHRPDFKQGYTAEAAVGAVSDVQGLSGDELHALQNYAAGFEAGMLESNALTQPGRSERIEDEE